MPNFPLERMLQIRRRRALGDPSEQRAGGAYEAAVRRRRLGGILDERDAVEGLAEDVASAYPEVRAEDLLVHRAEVHRVAEVPKDVQPVDVGRLTVKAALDRIPDEEHRRGSAVVGSGGRVLVRATSELRPRRNED